MQSGAATSQRANVTKRTPDDGFQLADVTVHVGAATLPTPDVRLQKPAVSLQAANVTLQPLDVS